MPDFVAGGKIGVGLIVVPSPCCEGHGWDRSGAGSCIILASRAVDEASIALLSRMFAASLQGSATPVFRILGVTKIRSSLLLSLRLVVLKRWPSRGRLPSQGTCFLLNSLVRSNTPPSTQHVGLYRARIDRRYALDLAGEIRAVLFDLEADDDAVVEGNLGGHLELEHGLFEGHGGPTQFLLGSLAPP